MKVADIIMVDNTNHDRSNNPLHFINSEQIEVHGRHLYSSNIILVVYILMYIGC